MEKNERIVLGSGKLYAVEYEPGAAVPEDATIETEENRLGYIQGGATLTYTPNYYEAKDDLGLVSKTVLTDEVVKLVSGVLTWRGETLKRICSTARVTEADGKLTVKIGGIGNEDGKNYLLRFVHTDKKDGDIRVTICGKNLGAIEIAFAKGKETVINAEFTAKPMDEEGTLVIFEETEPKTAPSA